MEEEIGQLVVGYVDIGKPVAIVIRESHAHAFADLSCNPRLFGDILKRPVAAVVIERIREAVEESGVAISPQFAHRITAKGRNLGRPFYVVHHE